MGQVCRCVYSCCSAARLWSPEELVSQAQASSPQSPYQHSVKRTGLIFPSAQSRQTLPDSHRRQCKQGHSGNRIFRACREPVVLRHGLGDSTNQPPHLRLAESQNSAEKTEQKSISRSEANTVIGSKCARNSEAAPRPKTRPWPQ